MFLIPGMSLSTLPLISQTFEREPGTVERELVTHSLGDAVSVACGSKSSGCRFLFFVHLAVCWMYMKSVLGSWRTISRACSPATGGHGYSRGGLIDKSTSSLPRSLGVRERDAQVPDPWTRCPSARPSLAPWADGGEQLRNLASFRRCRVGVRGARG